MSNHRTNQRTFTGSTPGLCPSTSLVAHIGPGTIVHVMPQSAVIVDRDGRHWIVTGQGMN